MSISAHILAEFKEELANTRKLLEAVPEDRLDWKPHPKSWSLGQLASHIAEGPGWVQGMMQDELDFAASGGDYKPFLAENGSQLLKCFEKTAAAFEEAVDGLSDEFLLKTWTARRGDQVLMSMPRHAALRFTGVNHIAHHRGQLTVYLRLLDVPVPATYGPTADDSSFG